MIFGSQAIKHWFPDFDRSPHDLDLISKERKMTREVQHYWWDSFQYILDNNSNTEYADPNFLYTIKVAHACWDIFWDKTMHDIMFLKNKGCELDQEFFPLVFQDFSADHRDKKHNMNMTVDEFFKDEVTRKFKHDDLHDMLAFNEKPLYHKIKKKEGYALSCGNKWKELTHEEQIKCALEEIYVIATERYIIPKKIPPKYAQFYSMKKLILETTGGWFNLFLIDNFQELLEYNKQHWLSKLKENKIYG